MIGHPEDAPGLLAMSAGGAGLFAIMTLMHRIFEGRADWLLLVESGRWQRAQAEVGGFVRIAFLGLAASLIGK